MNYIHQLQQRVAELERQIDDARNMNEALLDYVQSSKFYGSEEYGGDQYVHVRDIIQRAMLTRGALL